MAVRQILLLGNEKLYNPSCRVEKDELEEMRRVVADMHDTLMDFRKRYNAGRAIAAPQIGVFKRLIYMNVDHLDGILAVQRAIDSATGDGSQLSHCNATIENRPLSHLKGECMRCAISS